MHCVRDLETIIVLVLLAFNFIPQRDEIDASIIVLVLLTFNFNPQRDEIDASKTKTMIVSRSRTQCISSHRINYWQNCTEGVW